ncbi:hypothetical protein OIU78_029771 [Salix suchowensis]|nr:hypothetical protein OIU78_029771 [Salix suchowensis]
MCQSTLAKGRSERVQSRGDFMREVSLLNEGEKKGFFNREMHALLLLSLRSLPPEFKKLRGVVTLKGLMETGELADKDGHDIHFPASKAASDCSGILSYWGSLDG